MKKITLKLMMTYLLCTMAGTSLFAQIPFTEGFEAGTTGWTFANGTQTNKWIVGTDAPKTGTKSAYISNNGSSYAYTNTAASIVHLYRDITFTASPDAYLLSVDYWRGGGNYSSYLRVHLVSTTTTPMAGTVLPNTSLLGTFSGASIWQQAFIALPQTYSGTTQRLVFTWSNSVSSSTSPIAIDNMSITKTIPKNMAVTAGNLKTLLTATEKTTVNKLTVSGTLDARDIQFMRDSMPALTGLNISGASIVAYTGTKGPNYGYSYTYPANEMPQYAFYNNNTSTNETSLLSVTLPAGLTSIGNYAFYGCSGLTAVTLPAGLTSIGDRAFQSCDGLTSVTFPAGLTSIGDAAFCDCYGLTSVTFPAGLTSIGYSAFYSCSGLTSVTFPAGLTSIGYSAFYSCSGLTSVTLPAGLTSIGAWTFRDCSGLTSVTLPAGLTSIENEVFRDCSGLTEIINLNPVPVSITSNVFYGVNKTTCSLKVSTAALSLYQNANEWKDFLNITGNGFVVSARTNSSLLGSVSGLSNRFYTSGEIVSLTAIPRAGLNFMGWKTISGQAISTTNPFNVTITQDTILVSYFENAQTVQLTAAGTLKANLSNVAAISKLTLSGTLDARDIQFMRDSMPVLTELNISGASIVAYTGTEGPNYGSPYTYPANEMPQYAFCKSGSFTGNTSLLSVSLPAGLTSIGNFAFSDCSGLTSVTLPVGLTSIGDGAFSHCSGLTSVTLPAGLTSIGDRAFQSCDGLTSVTFPAGLTSIGDHAFSYCYGLTAVTLPAGLTSIGNEAFSWCSGLTAVTFPAGLTSIGDASFSWCSSLTAVSLPAGLTSIGDASFSWCSSLTAVSLPAGLTSIGDASFYSCTGLTSVTLPTGLTSIGNEAFDGCSGLTAVTFPAGLTSIGNYAFAGCNGLTEIINLNPVPVSITADVFYDVNKTTCTLKVPVSALSAYQNANVWKDFLKIIDDVTQTAAVHVKVYPNPVVNGKLTIETSPLNLPKGDFESLIQIYSLNGQFMAVYPITGEKTEIDISHLAQGTYLVKIGNKTIKVIKT